MNGDGAKRHAWGRGQAACMGAGPGGVTGDGAKRHDWGRGQAASMGERGRGRGGRGRAGRRLAKGDETLATSLTVLTEAASHHSLGELQDVVVPGSSRTAPHGLGRVAPLQDAGSLSTLHVLRVPSD